MIAMGTQTKVGGRAVRTFDTPELVATQERTFPVLEQLAYLQPLVQACVARDEAELDLIEIALQYAEGVTREVADANDGQLVPAEQGLAALLLVLRALRDLQRGPNGEDPQHRRIAAHARRAREALGRENRRAEREATAAVADGEARS